MTESITIRDVAACAVEVALLVIAVIAVRGLAGGGPGAWLAAAGALLLIGVIWGLLVAPKAPYLLAPGPRAALVAALFLAVSAAAVRAGLIPAGLLLAVLGTPLMTYLHLINGR